MKRLSQNKAEAAAACRATAAILVSSLLAVADAVDRTGPVVGDEDRAVLGEDDVVGTTKIALITFEPTRSEHFLLGVLAVRVGGYTHDLRTLVLVPVPGAVLGDQDVVLVFRRELIAGI